MLVKLAILFSGNGSNLENLLQKLHRKRFKDNEFEVVLCLCNNKNAFGIERARKFGLESVIVEHKNFATREAFDTELVRLIRQSGADLTILAGFMRILSPVFTQSVRAINLHPSLLPLFKGANAIKESFESDMKVGGVSIHYVNEELDGGQIIAQKAFEKTPQMSFEDYERQIHALEYELLPKVVVELFE